MSDSYKQAAPRREIASMAGAFVALISIPLLALAAIAAAAGLAPWWPAAMFAAGIVAARFLMMPAIWHDGAGWGLNRTSKTLFRMLRLPVGIEVLERKCARDERGRWRRVQ